MDSPERSSEIDLSDLERDLRRLQAGAIGLDRDRLLFDAGRASKQAEHRGRLTVGLVLVAFGVAIGFGGLFVKERTERLALEVRLAERERALVAPGLVADVSDRPIEKDSYLALRRNLLDDSPESRGPVANVGEPRPFPAGDRPRPEPLRARGSEGLIPL
jgi:hypothetical protein